MSDKELKATGGQGEEPKGDVTPVVGLPLKQVQATRPWTKRYTVYAMFALPRDLALSPSSLLRCTALNRIQDNSLLVTYRDESKYLTMVGDSVDHHYFLGRLLRLKKDSMGIVNLLKAREGELAPGPDEYIEEEASFLYDTRENFLMCELNRESVSIFSKYVDRLWRRVLERCGAPLSNFTLDVVPTEEFIRRALGHTSVSKIKVKLQGVSPQWMERHGAASHLVNDLEQSGELDVTLSVRAETGSPFNEELLNHLKQVVLPRIKEKATEFKLTLREGATFNLIGDNLVYYPIDVPVRKHSEMLVELRSEMKRLYEEEARGILRDVTERRGRQGPRLHDF